MDSFLLLDFIIKLFYVVVALIIMVLFLRWFDKLVGINFKASFTKVLEDGKAFSIYIGLRFIGISILISSII
jgi:hypothetical protein